MFGFLILNKPTGISSRGALDIVAKNLRGHKLGHAGTLDPLATGVLVACVGPATRLVSYVQRMPKFYHARFRMGYSSETEDLDSELVPVKNSPTITHDELAKVIPQFIGRISQRPPKFSALRVRGRRAYSLARAGREFELAPRDIMINNLKLIGMEGDIFELEIECGSGTYVRSLGRDIAKALGSCAVMTELERTAIGAFRVEDGLNLQTTPALDQALLHSRLISPIESLHHGLGLSEIELNDSEMSDLWHGRPLRIASDRIPASRSINGYEYLAVDNQGRLLAILKRDLPSDPVAFKVDVNFSGYWKIKSADG